MKEKRKQHIEEERTPDRETVVAYLENLMYTQKSPDQVGAALKEFSMRLKGDKNG